MLFQSNSKKQASEAMDRKPGARNLQFHYIIHSRTKYNQLCSWHLLSHVKHRGKAMLHTHLWQQADFLLTVTKIALT